MTTAESVLERAPAVVRVRRRPSASTLLLEVVREALYGLSRNRFRASLSMLGISWGIVSVVMLLAYGNGFRDALARGFANAFGNGVYIVWPGQTSMQAGGERAGRRVRLTVDDAQAVAELPLVKFASAETVETMNVSVGNRQSSYLIRGVAPEYGAMRSEVPAPGMGRFLNAEDVQLRRRVAFIGYEVHRKLFGEAPAVGQTIRVGGMAFEIIGVMKDKAQLSNYFRPDKESIFIPYSVVSQLWYQPWLDVLVWQAVDSTLRDQGRSAGARAARQAPRIQPERRAGACVRSGRSRPRRSRAA